MAPIIISFGLGIIVGAAIVAYFIKRKLEGLKDNPMEMVEEVMEGMEMPDLDED